ncbi:hypothetical protein D8I24_2269 (plasmid) [Cupriavidus necator H850]|nr:hypothetical protein D8I24_2269 [Cupriavidus necator H850]
MPARTSPAIINALNRAMLQALRKPAVLRDHLARETANGAH